MRLNPAHPVTCASLTAAVRRLTGDEELDSAHEAVESARAELEEYRRSHSLEVLAQKAYARRLSEHGLFILCGLPIASMTLFPGLLPAELALVAALGGMIGGPALGFYLMARAARREAAEQHAQPLPGLIPRQQRVEELQARYESLLNAPDRGRTGIKQDEHRVVIKGVPLARRKVDG